MAVQFDIEASGVWCLYCRPLKLLLATRSQPLLGRLPVAEGWHERGGQGSSCQRAPASVGYSSGPSSFMVSCEFNPFGVCVAPLLRNSSSWLRLCCCRFVRILFRSIALILILIFCFRSQARQCPDLPGMALSKIAQSCVRVTSF